jgi:hypothetical protein
MFTALPDPIDIVLPILLGMAFMLLGWFSLPLQRRIGIRPPSEVYTIARLRRSARITEQLGRLFLGVFGIFIIVQGVGPRLWSPKTTYAVSIGVMGLAGLIVISAMGVILAHWKA